ncbi:hypothetical protein [Corallococcus sp. CA053C]|uniref:hypothetical protein n=1 Tax=Corallococcus sp. CA053C TaxID=2316732 RepID=UPI0011C3E49F|nr:hypothetical protein [Corallococcus sp. CA053C]
MTQALAVLCILLCASGCSSDSVSFSIDNPTDAVIAVNIDGTTHEIKPHAAKDLSLRSGLHSMESATTGALKFVVYAKGRGGLINPTFSPYVTINEVYATTADAQTARATGSRHWSWREAETRCPSWPPGTSSSGCELLPATA